MARIRRAGWFWVRMAVCMARLALEEAVGATEGAEARFSI
jgi:hypothetical protein